MAIYVVLGSTNTEQKKRADEKVFSFLLKFFILASELALSKRVFTKRLCGLVTDLISCSNFCVRPKTIVNRVHRKICEERGSTI